MHGVYTRPYPPTHLHTAQESRTSVYIQFLTSDDPTFELPLPPKLQLLFTYMCKRKIFKTKIRFVNYIYKI